MVVNILYANIKNLNERIYTNKSMMKIISLYKKQEKLFGEYNNGKQPDRTDVYIENVTHEITDLYIKNGILKADINFLKNNEHLKKNIDDYVFVTRALGTIDFLTREVNVEELFAIDIVLKEYDAYPEQRLREKKIKRVLDI